MLTALTTPYTDTRAGDLAWALGREPLPALAYRDLRLGRVNVQLRLLGASHQVLVEGEDGSCSETVACMPGSSTPLPVGVSKRIGEWEYEFAARVETLSPGSFAGRAQELLAIVSDHPHGLAGTFPGAPNAFTALLVQRHAGHVHWRTWHSYPQEGRLVSTRTRVGAGYVEVVGPAGSAATAAHPTGSGRDTGTDTDSGAGPADVVCALGAAPVGGGSAGRGLERPDRRDRADRANRPDRAERPDRPERPERLDRFERLERRGRTAAPGARAARERLVRA